MQAIEMLQWLVGANIATVIFGAGVIVATVRQNQKAIREVKDDIQRHTVREDERAANQDRWQRHMESRVGQLEGRTSRGG